jgi:hypothetical protein
MKTQLLTTALLGATFLSAPVIAQDHTDHSHHAHHGAGIQISGDAHSGHIHDSPSAPIGVTISMARANGWCLIA